MPVDPKVKSAKTRELFNAGVRDFIRLPKSADDGFKGYQWKLEVASISPSCRQRLGNVRMVEFGRRLYLNVNDDAKTHQMFELMKQAEFRAEVEVKSKTMSENDQTLSLGILGPTP